MIAEPLNIAVAGAGIAGLAAAALLARDGHRVIVFDQFPAPGPVGSGLMVQPVGLAVLAVLGLDRALTERASLIERLHGRAVPSGATVLDVRYPAGRFGFAVQRASLFDLLHRAAENASAKLVPATTILRAGQSGGSATLEAQSGALGPFDLVLDCLGSGSPLCPKRAAPLSYGALWALLDWPETGGFDTAALEQRYRAASQMAGVLPVGRTQPQAPLKATFFWSLRHRDLDAWRDAPLEQWKQSVLRLWPDCRALLDQLSDHRQLIFARYCHRTLSNPVSGKIVHLGDSYHATSPQLGQGANMALLDALALAVALRAPGRLAARLARYASLRRWHVRFYQTASYLFTPVYQSDSRLLPLLRDRAMGPVSRTWPVSAILAGLVSGDIGLRASGLGLRP